MERVDPLELARRLIRARKAASLTQVGLADKAGKSPATISGLESGKIARPHLGTILDLAEALGIEPTELTGGAAAALKEPPPRSMYEVLDRVGAKTRYLALEEDEFGALWDDTSSAEERRALNRAVIEEHRLAKPYLLEWLGRLVNPSPERSRVAALWEKYVFLRTSIAAERTQRAALAEAEEVRKRTGDEAQARALLEDEAEQARELAGVG